MKGSEKSFETANCYERKYQFEKENSLKSVAEKHEEKSGWADAMAKVLKMGTNTEKAEPNKPLFLSKAIKDSEIKHRTSGNTKENIEVNNEEGTLSDQKSQVRPSIRRAQKKGGKQTQENADGLRRIDTAKPAVVVSSEKSRRGYTKDAEEQKNWD